MEYTHGDMLERIEYLRRDLRAEIVVQKGESHHEEQYFPGGPSRKVDEYIEAEWKMVEVIDKPRITQPDTEKREAARQELQGIYDTTDLCSVRYVAGSALGIDRHTLADQARRELSSAPREDAERLYNVLYTAICHYDDLGPPRELEHVDYSPTRSLRVVSARAREKDHDSLRIDAGRALGYPEGLILGDSQVLSRDAEELGKIYREGRNEKVRERAREKLRDIICYERPGLLPAWLYHEHKRPGDVERFRQAGEELGYSSFRMWLAKLDVLAGLRSAATIDKRARKR